MSRFNTIFVLSQSLICFLQVRRLVVSLELPKNYIAISSQNACISNQAVEINLKCLSREHNAQPFQALKPKCHD